MNKRELEDAIRDEVAEWPGVTVEFEPGGTHPKAKLMFGELVMRRPYAGTPSDAYNGLHKCLGDMRRVMKQLGAERAKPEPSKEDVEKRYSKRNVEGVKARDLATSKTVEPSDPKPDIADQLVEAGAATPEQAKAAQTAKITSRVLADADVEPTTPPAPIMLERLLACGLQIVPVGEISVGALIAGAADMIEDGIYFDLPAEVYHAVEALGSGSICDLIVSPGTFWRGSWFDPDRPELDEESTKAQILGKAYHTARLEPQLFNEQFVRELDKKDFPKGTLFTGTDMGKALEELGEKKSGSVGEQAQRLADAGFDPAKLWHLHLIEWERTKGDRTPIPAKFWDDIERDMERLRANDEIAAKLEGGAAEVSVFWTDAYGIRCKARFDYLRPDLWDDFKTFVNKAGKVLAQAIADAVRYNRIYIQAIHYREAAEAIRKGGLQIKGNATDDQRAIIAAIQIKPEELACWLIFQEKNGVPNLLAREFKFRQVTIGDRANMAGLEGERLEKAMAAMAKPTGIFKLGEAEILHAKKQFALYSQVYERGEAWAPIEPIGTIDDDDFSPYWLEGR